MNEHAKGAVRRSLVEQEEDPQTLLDGEDRALWVRIQALLNDRRLTPTQKLDFLSNIKKVWGELLREMLPPVEHSR